MNKIYIQIELKGEFGPRAVNLFSAHFHVNPLITTMNCVKTCNPVPGLVNL